MSPRPPRLLVYRTGNTHPDVVRDVDDYFQWFGRILGERALLVEHVAFEAPRAELDGIDGVIITGSPLSVAEPEPWMDEACEHLRGAARRGIPILGTCFGHQLLAHAFGGRVRRNPRGWEAGTHEVELTDEGKRDPLFAGLPPRFLANQSHRDEVEGAVPGAVLLARSGRADVQALAFCEHVRGVQFHPEMNGRIIHRVVSQRRELLTEDANVHGRPEEGADALLGRAADTPLAESVIGNFVEQFVRRA